MNTASIKPTISAGKNPCDLSQVVVIIPALNEEASLPFVLRDRPSGRFVDRR